MLKESLILRLEHMPPLAPTPHPHVPIYSNSFYPTQHVQPSRENYNKAYKQQKAGLEETEQASGPAMAGMLDLRMGI